VESGSHLRSANSNQISLGSSNTPNTALRLSAREVFTTTRSRCEDLLFEVMDMKIDQFMTLTQSIDWCPEKIVTPVIANGYITDLILFLETTLQTMNVMTDSIRDAAHFTCCKHIAANIMSILLADSMKKVNQLTFLFLSEDVRTLEQFAARCPISNLADSFAEVRQLCNLFETEKDMWQKPELFLDNDYRNLHYGQLAPSRLMKILDKYKDIAANSVVPDGVLRLKKKNVEDLMKQMKKLMR